MAHSHDTPSVEENFEFSNDLKKRLSLFMVLGVVLVALGAFIIHMGWWGPEGFGGGHGAEHGGDAGAGGHGGEHGDHHGATLLHRIVANLWLNSVYFLGISVVGAFFISYNYVAKAGWYTSFKRIPEAFPAYMIFPAAILLVLFLVPSTRHMVMHWTHEGIMDPASANYDKIIANKSWYLSFGFYLVRVIIYFVVWYYLWLQMRKHSILEDEYNDLAYYKKSRFYAKAFLIFFAVTSSTAAWDLTMTIDSHWFSTMFGWYHLASWHVAGLSAIMLAVIMLKEKGYMKGVNYSALQDLGKLMFGFSIFWTYVWFSQYLLIFYANLPEETVYFDTRVHGYGGRYFAPFMISLLLNFLFPLLILMARESKRNFTFLKLACWAILIGHWFDFYQMVMPGVAKEMGGIGLIEWGTTLVFASSFVYVVANQLTKANLYPKNHPFLGESMHHDI